jgi:hypothetical protein
MRYVVKLLMIPSLGLLLREPGPSLWFVGSIGQMEYLVHCCLTYISHMGLIFLNSLW